MKKSEMIEAIATSTGVSKTDAEKVFNATFDLFKDELFEGKFNLDDECKVIDYVIRKI